ncbi:hypothetical protein CCACVL1_30537 [Corchorus capsularis]|uniref:Uncharacterized protein n=1 Tax=Corchorus capsularis TaxID=210143 RepID=A0A1R3FWR0_COCAP|nr:hypothetical protein CCACVL1_30537 [Corchorus capsularis]
MEGLEGWGGSLLTPHPPTNQTSPFQTPPSPSQPPKPKKG